MARKSSSISNMAPRQSGPRRTANYKIAKTAISILRYRFCTKPEITCSLYLIPDYVRSGLSSIIINSFPDYNISVSTTQDGIVLISFNEFPYQLITEQYAGESRLSKESIASSISTIHGLAKTLQMMGHPTPLAAACENRGLTLRGYVDLATLDCVTHYNYSYNERVEVAFNIAKAPHTPNSIATLKLGVKDDSPEDIMCKYTASLVGNYTQEQQAQIAKELFREQAMFTKSTGTFSFDHFPKTLKVVGENLID